MFRIILSIEEEQKLVEIPLEIYFKSEERGTFWIKHHYLFVQELVWALKKTRTFDVELRRIR